MKKAYWSTTGNPEEIKGKKTKLPFINNYEENTIRTNKSTECAVNNKKYLLSEKKTESKYR